MNKSELVESVAQATGLSQKAAQGAVAAVLNAIEDAVAEGEKVVLPGFGTFEKRDRPARQGHNPSTGEKIKIAATSVPAFKVGSKFKAYVAANKKDRAAYRKNR